MCQINPMSEIRAIAEACRRECLPASARLLWRVLFDCANDRQRLNPSTNTYDWPDDFFPIDNAELIANSALEKRALLEARNRLKQIGAIDFKPGENNRRPARYKILYLTGCRYKYAPADVPAHVPAEVPAHVPAHVPAQVPEPVPISKDKDKEIEKDQKAAAERAREDGAFISAAAAAGIQAEQDQVLETAWSAGFQRSDAVTSKMLGLYAEHGLTRMLEAINECVDYGAVSIKYLTAVLAGGPKKAKKAGKVISAQQYAQREYDGEQEEAMQRMIDRINAGMG